MAEKEKFAEEVILYHLHRDGDMDKFMKSWKISCKNLDKITNHPKRIAVQIPRDL